MRGVEMSPVDSGLGELARVGSRLSDDRPRVVGAGQERRRRSGDAVRAVALDVRANAVGRAPDEELVDHFIGHRLSGTLAITGFPGIPHRLQLVTASQPL